MNRDDRQVRIVANASVGLDENFLAVLHDNTDAGMTSIRWQRFTSDTGVTRQFPAAFDDSGRDNRLADWYCQTTQVAKRLVIVLDMSDSMRRAGAMEVGRQAVMTLLNTLTEQDSVNVQLIAGSSAGMPSFWPKGLMPATNANIARLSEWMLRATARGQQSVSQAISEALGHLEVVKVDTREESDEKIEENIKNFVFLVSDGELAENDLALAQPNSVLDSISRNIKDASRLNTHVMCVAVGLAAKDTYLRAISCALNGLFFFVGEDQGRSVSAC